MTPCPHPCDPLADPLPSNSLFPRLFAEVKAPPTMDKNKIIEAAAKLVAKGAYDKAIKEYQKILEADPKDVRILQKMGELYQKKNDNGQAAHYFTKVAESYASDGFFLKAVALYKQVLKLNPGLIEVNLKLAELHQQLQLMSEAMAFYQIVANHYDKQGDVKASLGILKKMVDLDPDNVASRRKLAELYARENMNKEALAELRKAAEFYKRHSRIDDYLATAERISALEPNNGELARELAEQYLQRGDQKRALAKLQVCFKADPRDIDTLRLLAQAFQGLGQTSKTVSVYKELAKIYQEKGRTADADNLWRQIEQLDPNDPDVMARRAPPPPSPKVPAPTMAPQTRVAQPVAPPPPAPTRAVAPAPGSAAPPQNVGKDQLAKLLTETDVYVKYGLHDKALEQLRKVFAVDPENLDAHEKAYHIYVASNNHAQASEQLLNVLRLCTRRQEVARAQPYLATILQENPAHPEVPAFLAVLRASGAAVAAPAEQELPEDAILVDSTDEEIIVADAPEDALAVDDVALAAVASADAEEVVEEGSVSTYDLDGRQEDEPLSPPAPPREMRDAFDPEDVVQSAEIVVEDDFDSSNEAPVRYELGGEEDAPTGLSPALPGDERESAVTQPHDVPVVEPAEEELTSADVEEPVEPPPDEEPAQEECDEAQFFLDQGLFDEAREILETVTIAYPGHRRATEMLAQLEALEARAPPSQETTDTSIAPPSVSPVGEGGGEDRDAFDLAAELAAELGDTVDDTAGQGLPATDDFQYSVEEVFSEFKKGLQKVVKPEDVDTHYDLGIAYKEMGLVDDAIGEFEQARQGCIGKKKEIDCLTMKAMLQAQKGDFQAAVETFKEAMASEHATGEAEKALRYELGAVYEQAGEAGKALFHFQRVHKLDPKYRDVAAVVQRLQASASPEEDALPSGGSAPPNGANGAHPPAPAKGAPGQNPPQGGGGKARKVGYV